MCACRQSGPVQEGVVRSRQDGVVPVWQGGNTKRILEEVAACLAEVGVGSRLWFFVLWLLGLWLSSCQCSLEEVMNGLVKDTIRMQ